MKLGRRLFLASVALAVLVGIACAALIVAVATLQQANERKTQSASATVAALRLEQIVIDLETGLRGYVLTGKAGFLSPYHKALRQLPSGLQAFHRAAAGDPAQEDRAAIVEVLIKDYRDQYVIPLVNLARGDRDIVAQDFTIEDAKTRTDEIRDRLDAFRRSQERLASETARAADRRSQIAIAAGALGVLGSTALILLFGVYLSRSIAGPVRAVAGGASRLAGGELSLRLPEAGPGEIGDLTRSFNAMAAGLQAGQLELERQNEKLRESERLKTELISIVSHELRTPLSSVIGFTTLLLQREFDPQARRHYLGIVDAQARRLASLLEDFLDVQKIEAGRLELTHELVDLASLADDQVELYAAQSPNHSLAFEVEQRPLQVRGDANRLAQVVGNLLSNAIKYSPEGGRVELEGGRNGASVRISVRDEGLGIATEQQSRIFTKFFRAEAGASGIAGTGLGLAFSREVVEAHGGRIGFDSTVGEGSTFWVELPAAFPARAEQGRNGSDRKEST